MNQNKVADRDRIALGALKWYQAMPRNNRYSFNHPSHVQALVVEMIADLLHYSKERGLDPDAIVRSAMGQFAVETTPEPPAGKDGVAKRARGRNS